MKPVLIVGGGIGGLTTALALHRRGLEARVYEAAPALQPVGKGIWVPTNAMQVLQRLGVGEAVASAGWALERIRIGNDAGRTLLEADLGTYRARYGHTTISIHRAALMQALADALPDGTLVLGRRAVDFGREGDEVVARFDDGTAERGSLLVGADGLRSAVRERFFPGVRLRDSGQVCYRGVGALELPPDLARTCWEVWGGAVRFGFSAIGPRQVYWFAPISTTPGDPDTAGPWSARLAARYDAFPDPIPEVLRATPAEEVIRTELLDFPPLARWCDGRVALLGDAAHAMTPNLGQGGAQAIEDAHVLAARLAPGGPVEAALREYERLRIPRVRRIVQTAWRFGQLAHLRRPWLRRLRDLAIRCTPASVNDRQMDRLYALPD